MAHFAKVENDIVTHVIVADQDFVDNLDGEWIKTSFNIRGGVYYTPNTNTPAPDQSIIEEDEGRKRKNFGYPGIVYRRDLDAFLGIPAYPSWVLNEETCLFEAPVPYPEDDKEYLWDEDVKNWVIHPAWDVEKQRFKTIEEMRAERLLANS